MKPIPTISKNSPLKIEESQEIYKEGDINRKGKAIFVFGVMFSVLLLVATWLVFGFWLKYQNI
jgi:hypothetical protein